MRTSHGNGKWTPDGLQRLGVGSALEEGVRVFHQHLVSIGENVYVGHDTHLKAYHILPNGWHASLIIGDGSWIGQQCFFHSAGGIRIGKNVGIGPCVRILTSKHREAGRHLAILHSPLDFAAVEIDEDADIGVGAMLLPGVHVGKGAQIGAGSVVTKDVADYAVVAGNPARVLRMRDA